MGAQFSQLFPPSPKLTEKNIGDQTGKVFIVTGSSSGIGEQLAYILYLKNAKVYMAARSKDKAAKAIEGIKSRAPNSKGQLIFLHLDLDDLETIKSTTETFLAENDRLDVLWNNAGVMVPPQGSKTKQGYEKQLGTNNVAPFLLTKLLHPILAKTASTAPKDSVRVVWVSSSGAEVYSPKGGVDMNNLDYKTDKNAWWKYGTSKAGNVLHASEFAKRFASEGIISVVRYELIPALTRRSSGGGAKNVQSLNPGNLKSDLQRHTPKWQLTILNLLLHEPIYGAYTELFAGLSPDVTASKNGAWILPWGRFAASLREDIVASLKTKAEGGTGVAAEFWEWTEEQIKSYA